MIDTYRADVLKLYREHVNSGQARLASMMDLPIERSSKGVHVYDERGRRYLDAGGYGVFLLGHGHPVVVEAVGAQLRQHAMSTRLLLSAEQAHAAAALSKHSPAGLQYTFFCNSGSEATEAALKLARLNGCEIVVSTHGGYHGKTLGSLSVTGRETYRSPFADRLGTTRFIPYGDAEALEAVLSESPAKACVILEPVQAEAGVIVPPEGYLHDVRTLCNRHKALLIFDEIQCGMGRTGRWWSSEREQVVPDIMLVGKSLSGGCVPVGAMIASAEVYAPFNRNPLIHSSTFGGNPLAMAAVRATFEVMDIQGLVGEAARLGVELEARMRQAIEAKGVGRCVQLRVAGLLIGIEFVEAADGGRLVMALLKHGVIACHSLNDHRVVRLTPAAVMSPGDCDQLIAAFENSLADLFD